MPSEGITTPSPIRPRSVHMVRQSTRSRRYPAGCCAVRHDPGEIARRLEIYPSIKLRDHARYHRGNQRNSPSAGGAATLGDIPDDMTPIMPASDWRVLKTLTARGEGPAPALPSRRTAPPHTLEVGKVQHYKAQARIRQINQGAAQLRHHPAAAGAIPGLI